MKAGAPGDRVHTAMLPLLPSHLYLCLTSWPTHVHNISII